MLIRGQVIYGRRYRVGTVLEQLVAALREAATYNKNDKVAPAAVLWTDKERVWEPLLPRLRVVLPLLTLGAYEPTKLTGPAIWLRCMIAGTLPEPLLPEGTPILYLPDVSRQELRAVEECPKALQPLAELQYRGVFFTHKNGRDWTPAAFLAQLGAKVAEDNGTKEALDRALLKVMDESVSDLQRQAPLRAPYFLNLLHPDPAKRLLEWLNDPAGVQTRLHAEEPGSWAAFCELCQRNYGFNPETDGDLSGAEKLGRGEGAWELVWSRFAEAPRKYPHLPDLLRRAKPPQGNLFDRSPRWPQDNEEGELSLRQALLELAKKPEAEARAALAALEPQHGARRDWVWADLAQAPLAQALVPLGDLAARTATPLGHGTPTELAQRYADELWRVDAAALEVLEPDLNDAERDALCAAVRALYGPWLEQSALSFQEAVANHGLEPPKTLEGTAGRCLLFSDGLRYDVSQALAALLVEGDHQVSQAWRMGALPGVTPTAKPAISPVGESFTPGSGFEVLAQGIKVTAQSLRRNLEGAGFTVLLESEADPLGTSPQGAWTEFGNLDRLGHAHGWRLSQRIPSELRDIASRVSSLLEAGWREVVICTDHGWLLMPGGLPKLDLPNHLTDERKGRCARLKAGVPTEFQTVPWHYDADVSIAVAKGSGAFITNSEYEHGGLSVQECVLPLLTVTKQRDEAQVTVTVEGIKWSGLRCRVQLQGAPAGTLVDLRTRAADPQSSVAAQPVEVDEQGKASLLVPDEEAEGTSVALVVLDGSGQPLIKHATVVGE